MAAPGSKAAYDNKFVRRAPKAAQNNHRPFADATATSKATAAIVTAFIRLALIRVMLRRLP